MESLPRIFLLRTLWLAILVCSTSSQNDIKVVKESEIVGIQGLHLNIPCTISSLPDVEYVRWADLVNNVDRDPITIFDSRGNPSFGINEDHPKQINFMVEKDYTLEIVFLEIGEYGEYICEVKKVNDSQLYQEKFMLSVLRQPKCEPGQQPVLEGQEASLSCEMEYGAYSLPTMEWLNGKMEMIQSMDMTDIGKFVKKVSLKAEPSMNGETFTCKAGIGEKMQTCAVTVQVNYAVRSIDYSPKKDTYQAGDKLVCESDGNPPPSVVWRKKDANGVMELTKGSRIAELEVKDIWVGEEVMLLCSASNEVGGTVTLLNKTLPTFQALERPPTPAPTQETGAGATKTGGVGLTGVVGGLVAAAVVIIIIIAIVYIIKKRNSKKSQGLKPVPNKDPEDHKDDTKGTYSRSHDVGLAFPVEKRPYSPPPSDPRYRNMDGLHYPTNVEVANNNDDDTPWKKMSDNQLQHSNIRRP